MMNTRSAQTTPWLSVPRANPNGKLRLFCFPYSGAAASIYYNWSDTLPNFIEVCPVQYPGRGTRVMEPLLHRLADLVENAYQGLSPFFDLPYAFFGHSLGAQVAFELARRVTEQGLKSPVYLFISGHTAPQWPEHESPLYALPEDDFIARLRSLNGTPDEVLNNLELRELLLPILRADFEVSETYQYQPGPPLNCPICACGGIQDSFVTRESLEGWRIHTTSRFSVRMFPGDHFYLNQARAYLLQVIARELLPYA